MDIRIPMDIFQFRTIYCRNLAFSFRFAVAIRVRQMHVGIVRCDYTLAYCSGCVVVVYPRCVLLLFQGECDVSFYGDRLSIRIGIAACECLNPAIALTVLATMIPTARLAFVPVVVH